MAYWIFLGLALKWQKKAIFRFQKVNSYVCQGNKYCDWHRHLNFWLRVKRGSYPQRCALQALLSTPSLATSPATCTKSLLSCDFLLFLNGPTCTSSPAPEKQRNGWEIQASRSSSHITWAIANVTDSETPKTQHPFDSSRKLTETFIPLLKGKPSNKCCYTSLTELNSKRTSFQTVILLFGHSYGYGVNKNLVVDGDFSEHFSLGTNSKRSCVWSLLLLCCFVLFSISLFFEFLWHIRVTT